MNHTRKQVAPDEVTRLPFTRYFIGGHLLTRVVHFVRLRFEITLENPYSNAYFLLSAPKPCKLKRIGRFHVFISILRRRGTQTSSARSGLNWRRPFPRPRPLKRKTISLF